MLKEERFQKIMQQVDQLDTVRVTDLAKELDVTEMTIRRDLDDLEAKQLLVRIHGGARKKRVRNYTELSHGQKRTINVEEKRHIASKCAELIKNEETVFIGPGTTNELIYDYLNHIQHADIVTNAITIFERFKEDSRFDVILIGGRYRQRSGTFIGYFANQLLNQINVNKAFIGTNGIIDLYVTTANEDEGSGQKLILDNAGERYVVADHSKFGMEAFHRFYKISDLTGVVTDPGIDEKTTEFYKKYTQLIY